DKNGQLWIGTGDGLFVFNPEQKFFENFLTKVQTGRQISLRGITVKGSVIYANSYLGTVSTDTQSKVFETTVPLIKNIFWPLNTLTQGLYGPAAPRTYGGSTKKISKLTLTSRRSPLM